jgi:glycosyltransferase involved in cell wall biosynthesis
VRVALDATYTIDSQPSGIAIYSQHMLHGLATQYPADKFTYCYRPRQFLQATSPALPNTGKAILLPRLPTFRAEIFHALNQRVDGRGTRRVVSTFHDLFVMTAEYSSESFRERFTRQAREAAQRSDLLITVSEFTAGQVSDLLNIPRSRIRVIPHGVALPANTPNIAREQIVLFVGALQTRKNVIRLVEAFETLREPWRLVLAGAPSGYQAEQILNRINASPARERIEVTGYLSQQKLNEFFARASIFAFPSLDEGFGIPVLEAMAWGLPVITSNSSALAELGRDAALLIDPLSVQEIAGALSSLAVSKSLRETLAAAGKLRAEKFTWKKAIEKTYAVYSELL